MCCLIDYNCLVEFPMGLQPEPAGCQQCDHSADPLWARHFGQQGAAVQQLPPAVQLSLTMFSTNSHLTLCSDMHIKGVCITKVTNPKMCLVTLGNQPINVSLHQGNQYMTLELCPSQTSMYAYVRCVEWSSLQVHTHLKQVQQTSQTIKYAYVRCVEWSSLQVHTHQRR